MAKTHKTLKCYYCGGEIEDEVHDLVIKPIPLHTKVGIRNYKRKFHIGCVSKFVSKLDTEKETGNENSDWDKCYQYAKELLNVKTGQNLDQHAINRLLGLRVGQYYPNGNNVRGLKRGYGYETILMTMKFSTGAIKQAFGTMQFKDQKHKIDYAMKIVTNNLNFIQGKIEARDKAIKSLDRLPMEETNAAEYVKKGGNERGRIHDKIGSLLDSNSETEDILDLFD